MHIRATVKGIILRDDEILLNYFTSFRGRPQPFYGFPGGGQLPGETMEEALRRECLEETGYAVRVVRFAALYETICGNEEVRRRYPEYVHRLFHFFVCEAVGEPGEATERDIGQHSSRWLPLSKAVEANLHPRPLRAALKDIAAGAPPRFLGSVRTD